MRVINVFTWGSSVSKLGPDDQRRKPGVRFSSFDHNHNNDDDDDVDDDDDDNDIHLNHDDEQDYCNGNINAIVTVVTSGGVALILCRSVLE